MDESRTGQTLLIGTGGSKPGIWMMPSDGRLAEPILSLPPGHSVYALDVDPEGERIAIGDRAGNIQVFSWPGLSTGVKPEKLFHLTQGAPVLSVCLAGGSMLVSSDTQGKCLLWSSMEDEDHPISLEGDGSPTCSLSKLNEDRIVGLSAVGSLLIWDSNRKRLLESLACPRPPRKLGFVKLVHWPENDAVVYPAEKGLLAVIKLSIRNPQIHKAHKAPLYACIVNEEKLHTIGGQDGCMKTWIWDDAGCKVVQTGSAPRGVVSGELFDAIPCKLLLTNREGEAAIYGLDDGSLHLIQKMEGNYFRVATGPAASARRVVEERQRITLCQNLRDQAIERINSGKTEGIEDLYRQITETGFESVAAGLRAHQAYMQDNIIDELRARHRLFQIMSDPGRDSLHRYATLLMKAWRIPEAKKIFDQIQATGPPNSYWLEKSAKALRGKAWIIEPDLPIPFLIEAATILDRPFAGRWVVETSSPIPFPNESLEAETMVSQYEQVVATDHIKNILCPEAQRTWWISEGSVHKADVVVFTDPSKRNKAGFIWAVQIVKSDMGCNLVPTVLFETGLIQTDQPLSEWHRSILSVYEEVTSQEGSYWPRKLSQDVTLTIRRLRTRARSCREWNRG